MYTSRRFKALPQAIRSVRNNRDRRRSRRRTEAILQVVVLEERAVPSLLGQPLFPSDYPTNASIAGAPVSGNSATWISAMAATRSHLIVNWGAYTPASSGALYSMPYNIVHSKDTVNYTKVKVYIDNYPNESDLSGTDSAQGNRPYVLVPMPKVNPQNLFIEGDSQKGADPSRFTSGGSDSHLIVWDADTDTAYEMWEASRPSESAVVPSGYYINAAIANQWNAANEATWNMAADSFRTLGYTSGDAAGLPILNNVARPDEALPAADGGQSATPAIDHALRFTLPRGLISGQFTYPASHVARGGGGIPYGTRFRLKSDAATNALIAQMGPESQVIARALQQYGLILADIGSSMFVQGAATAVDTNNNPIIDPTTGKPITWNMNDLTPDAVSGHYTVGLDSLPTSSFEAVDLSPRVTSLSASSGQAGNIITVTGVNFSGAAGNLSVLFVPPGNPPGNNNPPYTSNGQVTTLKPGVVAAGSVTIVDDQHLQVVVPSGAGTVDIQVLSGRLLDDTYNSDAENATAPIFGYGISTVSTSDQFTYSTVSGAPNITTQPTNQTVTAGQTATFTAAASGSPTPTVQWQVSTNGGSTWTSIAGATATAYSLTNTTTSQNGSQYRAFFTNTAGTATSNAATLTVSAAGTAPSVTTQPTNQTVTAGQTATFTAAAGGSPPPTVQWQVSTNGGSTWSNISGAAATTYSLTNTTTSQNGSQYRAVFTNTAGTATTNAATLTVNAAGTAPSVTTQPTNQTVTAGQTATFTAAAGGSPTPTVQWQVSTNAGSTWTNIAGATAAAYSLTNTSTSQSGSLYRAVFTNTVGTATTNAATLTVNAAATVPSVTTQPTNQSVTAGQTAIFTAAAIGNPTPTVQWQVSTNAGSTWTNIAGATAATYSLTNTTTSQNGSQYRALFTNSAGSATTSAATLTVSAATGSTTVTFQQGVSGYTGGQDAGIDTQYAIYNGGNGVQYLNQTNLEIGTDSQGAVFETLLRFSNLGLPTNAVVATASLTVTIVDWVGGTSVTGYYVNNAWSTADGTIGWLRRGNGLNWSTPGALGQGTDLLAGKTFALPTTKANGSQTMTINLDPSVVQNWIANPAADQGVLLVTNAPRMVNVVTAENATVSSRPALKVTYSTGAATAPSITTQPTNPSVTAGQTATFTAAASGSPTPTVQWQVSTNSGSTWTSIAGATATSYSLTNTTTSQNGSQYRALFTNTAGSATTNAATLTVNAAVTAPSVTTQPTNQSVIVGQTATFTAAASGNPTPTVQWQVSTNGGSNWSNVAGATATTYSLTNTTTSQNSSQYRAVFTNSAGSATTSAATLTVSAATGSTTVTFQQGVSGYTGGQDAGIDTQYAIYNGGNGVQYLNQTNLEIGTDSQGAVFETLLRFSSLGLPTNAVVTTASLTVTIVDWVGGTSVTGYYVNNSWSTADGTIGWLHRGNGSNWSTPGALGQGTDLVAGKSFTLPTTKANGAQMMTINLDPSVVQNWIANPAADQGVLLVSNTPRMVNVVTAENATVSSRPVLKVTYSTPATMPASLSANVASNPATVPGLAAASTIDDGPVQTKPAKGSKRT